MFIYKLQRPCQFNNSTETDGKFSVVARNVVVTVYQSRVPALSAFISTIGFGSIKSYTNCRNDILRRATDNVSTVKLSSPIQTDATLLVNNSQHYGSYMLHLFAHPVACCCVLLGFVA